MKSEDMNEFQKCRRDCLIGAKAYQNIRSSVMAFERLNEIGESTDLFLRSALFHTGVIRYAKPFTKSKMGSRPVVYPCEALNDIKGFSIDIHNHLMMVRNTLVAHDDFTQIEPKILTFGISPEGSNMQLPASVIIANKCISHLAGPSPVQKFKNHIIATLHGISKKLSSDLDMFRTILIAHPEQAQKGRKYIHNYCKVIIPAGGIKLTPPASYTNNEWLEIANPDFSEIHDGFQYEEIRISHNFSGTEKITLPNGHKFEVTT